MSKKPHLIVEAGPDCGLEIVATAEGIQLGRASSNDVALADPLLSRHHCRLTLRADGSLWVTDLDSANETLVNDLAVTEAQLKPGDKVLIGETLLRVLGGAERSQPAAPTAAAAAAAAPTVSAAADERATPAVAPQLPLVDLGFDDEAKPASRQGSLRPLIWAAGAAALLLLGAALIMRMPSHDDGPAIRIPQDEMALLPFELHYEKVEADRAAIFRYEMHLTADMTLSVRIDDLAENRHVRRETRVETNLVRELAHDLNESGFFALSGNYDGIPNPNIMKIWDLALIVGQRVKRVQVNNRLEPEVFQAVRERIETFGRNQLGIWAIQYSREKLLGLAEEALTRASNLFDERGIAYGNLWESIRRYRDAENYLDTVDPKPDFYGAIVSGQAQATEELNKRYEEQRFLADRALNLKNWDEAVRELRVLRELIPESSDQRHIEATRKLLDVENRLKSRERP